MQIDIKGKYRIYLRKPIDIQRLEKRNGICSRNFETDKHCLLFDFDDAEISAIKENLKYIQTRYHLPTILIFESSKKHYHAYCFCARSFKEIIHILSDTTMIDIEYLRLGMVRGYYTLRFSEKDNIPVKLHSVIASILPDEMSPLSVTTNSYFTTNTGGK